VSGRGEGAGEGHNVNAGAAGKDWEWRRKVRSNPQFHLIYRILVGVVGLLVLALGLVLLPLPGPGWLVVLLGLAIWASEFAWAQRLMHAVKRTLDTWSSWLKPQPWWVKGLVLLLTIVVVAGVFWLLFLTSGVPRYLPDVVEEWLRKVPGLGETSSRQ
jgi:uncharacterized protein (TIGR02611 family)